MDNAGKKTTLIIAVSGGVDSVSLLHMLVNKTILTPPFDNPYKLVVAHFDHGIRPDSTEVGRGVGEIAKQYNLPFEIGVAHLGPASSEAKAREYRYNFLRQCCNKYETKLLITAHHQDDVLETIVLNLIRGTNWRGLMPMTNSYFGDIQIIRPLLNLKKPELQEYAKQNSLTWFDDSTNTEQAYLRNYIRHTIIPAALEKDSQFTEKLLAITNDITDNYYSIATMLQKYIDHYSINTTPSPTLSRYCLTMLPSSVSLEVLYMLMTQLDLTWHPTTMQLKRSWWFVRGGQLGKTLQVSKNINITITKEGVQFKNRAQYATLA
jgi:tRNA(Ile)-lysidine synthetase-like protein